MQHNLLCLRLRYFQNVYIRNINTADEKQKKPNMKLLPLVLQIYSFAVLFLYVVAYKCYMRILILDELLMASELLLVFVIE
jgi:hypothetical protein